MGRLMWCSQLLCRQLVLLLSLSCANLCSHDESSALLRFKQLFSFVETASDYPCNTQLHYPKMKYWKEDTDCCSWDGITCDMVTGHVIGLDLSCSWLYGRIPSNSSLFLLSHLQKLNLALNDFNLSQIPSDFVRFPSLTHLNLSSSNFSGQVPLEISHLSKLTLLHIGSLYHGVLALETLVMKGLVQNMSHLQELSLGSVNMSTVALDTLTNINLPSLKFLRLARWEFPRQLYNCTKLQVLHLSSNYLVGPIPDDINRISGLQFLGLGYNNFSGDIPPAIGRLSELKVLNLYQNEFNGTFPVEIGDLLNLQVLGLSYNDKFVPAKIPVEFGKLKNLTTLYFAEANLIGEIPDSSNNLLSLEYLDLSINHLEGKIPSWAFRFKNLTILSLHRNRLSGKIPETVETLNLVEIHLSMNNLTGLVPEDFGKLQNLQLLTLFSNQLSGEIPSSIGLIPNLKVFLVFNNNLSGVLPPELGLLSKLEVLEVPVDVKESYALVCILRCNLIDILVRCIQHFVSQLPMSMVLPRVVGFKLSGKLCNGVTATDPVLTVTQMLRKHG
ncbi:hypothetical protein EZV62_008934 [Acer yangbiense]|uniref:Leucine-rich repeat-containing N-terminal plant-type domain-containing protein n=1 Tax=Acer yangbiense TaxID=1000413 RepID=A0A5C7IF90_9ROSI|nr:hypothetical protein EZV62_008934 [Acer yangbiense]